MFKLIFFIWRLYIISRFEYGTIPIIRLSSIPFLNITIVGTPDILYLSIRFGYLSTLIL